jgi:transposase
MGAATVGRIYAQFTERKAKERLSLECPSILGIDEHSLHRRQRFATTFCDLKNHRVFDITPGKSDADLQGFLGGLRGRRSSPKPGFGQNLSETGFYRKWRDGRGSNSRPSA